MITNFETNVKIYPRCQVFSLYKNRLQALLLNMYANILPDFSIGRRGPIETNQLVSMS